MLCSFLETSKLRLSTLNSDFVAFDNDSFNNPLSYLIARLVNIISFLFLSVFLNFWGLGFALYLVGFIPKSLTLAK